MTAVYPPSQGADTSPAPEAEELKADARQAMFYGATALACSFALLGVYFLTMPPLGVSFGLATLADGLVVLKLATSDCLNSPVPHHYGKLEITTTISGGD